jgi:hypothetical protein
MGIRPESSFWFTEGILECQKGRGVKREDLLMQKGLFILKTDPI